MTAIDFGLMFTLGLLSSLHCVQMCGPIVVSSSIAIRGVNEKAPTLSALSQNHLAYNAGRILTYSVLGAIAGLAGGTLGLLGRLSGFTHAAALVSGGLMIVIGISMLGAVPAGKFGSRLFRIPSSSLQKVGRMLSAPGIRSRFFLGLALGFLPCGLIYAALLKAMATGSAIEGAATMVAFGLGTAGALFAVGVFSSALRLRLNRWGSQFAAAGITLMGALLIWRGTIPTLLLAGGHMHGHH